MNFWINKQSVANDRTASVSIITELYVTHVRNSNGYLAIMWYLVIVLKMAKFKALSRRCHAEGGRQMMAISSDQTFHVLHVRHMMFIRVLSYCGT